MPAYTPYLLQHVNLSVPAGTLPLADEFYGTVLGLPADPVPQLQADRLRWFRIGAGPQQLHVSSGGAVDPDPRSSNHPCFSLPSSAALVELQTRIFEHMKRGGEAAAMACDPPGGENSGSKGIEYPSRFFVRDYAGNRLEFNVWTSGE